MLREAFFSRFSQKKRNMFDVLLSRGFDFWVFNPLATELASWTNSVLEWIDVASTRTKTSMEQSNMSPQQVAELQKEIDRLSLEKDQYLETLSNGEALKLQLRETRKDAKHLSKQMKKLQAMADIEGTSNEEVILYSLIQNYVDMFRRG